jgi:hypothetical protein
MSDDEQTEHAWHRRLAVAEFNRCWDLIDKVDRSVDDRAEMLLAATTSRWHWAQIGGPEETAAGDWQIGHVASLLGFGDLAKLFADRNLATATAEGWTGWRLASAHEGVARACAMLGDGTGRERHVAEARAALSEEDDAGNVEVVAGQLATIPEVPSAP